MIQSRRQFLKQAAGLGSASLLGGTSFFAAASTMNAGSVRVQPREYPGAFANPLKGFRPDLPSPDGGNGLGLDNPLATVARHYIRWNQFEASASDGVEAFLEFYSPVMRVAISTRFLGFGFTPARLAFGHD